MDPVYSATTVAPGAAVTATKISGDYSLDSLVLGKYSIVESGQDDTTAGSWAPQGITCNGMVTSPTSSDVQVTLTMAEPHITCAFTNAFTALPPTSTTSTTTVAPATTTTVPGGAAATDTGAHGSGNGQVLAMTGEDVRIPLGISLALAGLGASLMALDGIRRRRAPVALESFERPAT